MRIGVFTESYEPIVNGVSVCVATLRDELAKRGHEVFVFAPAYKGHVERHEKVFRFPSRHTVLMRDYPFPIPYAPGIRREFESLGLDVVHTQTPFLLGVLGARWARACGIPLVSTNHTLYTEYVHYVPVRPKSVTRAFLIGLMRWYYRGCDAVVVPSSPVERMLRSYGISAPIRVIKTGVVATARPDPALIAEVRKRFGVGDGDCLFLYVGRIAREKNLTMLLRAFRDVLRRHPSSRLVLVGGGPALTETKGFARELGVSEALEFVGMLPRDQIDPIYSAADVFVFPSTTETQGIAICEALSAGLPVVAVVAGGIPENVQPGVDGYLTANDHSEFADRMSELASDAALRAEMGVRAHENSRNFSIEHMVADFEELYSSLAGSAARGKPAEAAQA
jgi:1,2-diacylglycerol 3-alpha-glucosyltransferase